MSFRQTAIDTIPNLHRFSHQAMATTFQVIVQHEDEVYARQAAEAGFDEIDRLETQLSRFIDNSDVARINRLPAGAFERVSIEVFECLELSLKAYRLTDGAFDITIGSLLRCWRNEDKSPRTPDDRQLQQALVRTGADKIILDRANYAVGVAVEGLEFDLGGIGKGYAIDKLGELLREWSIDRALVHGGFSSVLALDGPEQTDPDSQPAGWPVTFSDPSDRSRRLAQMSLQRRAMSGSGVQKGRHIIDPRTGTPVKGVNAAWVSTVDATLADALSTAFMVMGPDQARRYCRRHPDVMVMMIVQEQAAGGQMRRKVEHFGPWTPEQILLEDPYLDESPR